MGFLSTARAKKPQHPIPIYKQQDTTLQAHVPPLGEFIPLSLRPSITISFIFDSISYTCENPVEKDAALRVAFERVLYGPPEMKTLLIEINTPDSYNILLDIVKEFRGCSETAKCSVRVDIILGR